MSQADQKAYQKLKPAIVIALVIVGIGLILLSFFKDFTVIVNGTGRQVRCLAFTPGQVIRAAGYSLNSEDRVFPNVNRLLLTQQVVILEQALPVEIVVEAESFQLFTTERIPANLLIQAGIKLFPEDRLIWNAAEINPAEPLPPGIAIILQFEPAHRLMVRSEDVETILFTDQHTLAAALWQAGIQIDAEDKISLPLETILEGDLEVVITRAKPVTVSIGDQVVSGLSAAGSVAEALADLGLSLQNLDYTEPAEDQSVPEDGSIKLVRVQEEILLEKEETAYSNTYEDDPNAELDTTSVLVPGQLGLVVTRSRIRLEDGIQTSSLTEGPWKASGPIDGVLGRGTKVVIHTETINGDTIEYWRKVSVYATSYMPSSQGGSTGTASGTPLTKGVIAVTRAWYNGMAFQQVYVPGYGYGMIADTGGGIDGRYWIDLGFDNDNYESWHYWTTLYFLTPVPSYIPVVLP